MYLLIPINLYQPKYFLLGKFNKTNSCKTEQPTPTKK